METPTNPQNQQANQAQTPQPESSWRSWIPLAILIVAAAIVGWQLGQPHDKASDSDKPGQTAEQSQDNQDEAMMDGGDKMTDGKKGDHADGTIRISGTLLPSQDPTRGNVMLKTGDSVLYVFTSRDIVPLLDKEVVLTGTGSMEKFVVTDIQLAK